MRATLITFYQTPLPTLLLLHSTTLSPLLCWAQIFISVLGNLPPSNSVRRGAYFMLSMANPMENIVTIIWVYVPCHLNNLIP